MLIETDGPSNITIRKEVLIAALNAMYILRVRFIHIWYQVPGTQVYFAPRRVD